MVVVMTAHAGLSSLQFFVKHPKKCTIRRTAHQKPFPAEPFNGRPGK